MDHEAILQALISGGLETNIETSEANDGIDYSHLGQVRAPSRILFMHRAKNESAGLGFVTEGRAIVVSQVVKDGPAWRCGIR